MMQKLDNPYIVKIHEFFDDGERVYIVQELCRGGELFDVVNKMSK